MEIINKKTTSTSSLTLSANRLSCLPRNFSKGSTNSTCLSFSTNYAAKKRDINLTLKEESLKNQKKKSLLFRTPNKTPLQLSAKKINKLSQNNGFSVINDRYIPNRVASNMEVSYHLLHNGCSDSNLKDLKDMANANDNTCNMVDNIKRKLIIDSCNGIQEKAKILQLHNKNLTDMEQSAFMESIKIFYNSSLVNSGKKIQQPRAVCPNPERILDAPEFKDDYYLNLLDWSINNNLAVALNRDMYIWNATSGEITELFSMDDDDENESTHSPHYISASAWLPYNHQQEVLAIGKSNHNVELWDVNTQTLMRTMKSQQSRVGCLAWNDHIITSGSRSGTIHNHDVRIRDHHVSSFNVHTQEVCGLKWSYDGKHLASGANDNLVSIWDERGNLNEPLFLLREHTAAVKAVSWCPWQNNLLATGGGTADAHIKIWNIYNGSVVQDQNAKSQISCLLWSKQYKELISSHGFQQNQLSIWKYPEMSKVTDLTGHTGRVLMMAMSPDEEIVASISADETLRLWKCFDKDKRNKEKCFGEIQKSSSHASLTRSIR